MSTTRSTSTLGDADFDLSALTRHLEAEILPREPQSIERLDTRKERLGIVVPPEAIVTLGVAICVGALWLVRVLPY